VYDAIIHDHYSLQGYCFGQFNGLLKQTTDLKVQGFYGFLKQKIKKIAGGTLGPDYF